MMTRSRKKFTAVRLNRQGLPKDLKHKTLRLKRGDIRVRTRGDLTAVVWRDERDVCMLTNIHDPPSESNFQDEHGNAIKPAIVADYNCHMGYVDKADRMANSYPASRRTWKWTKKIFSHLFNMTILNSYILLSTCGGKEKTEIFDSPLSGRCWQGLGMNPDHPGL